MLDLVVIGCGPAGLALAAESAKLGLSVGLIGPDLPFTNNYGVWEDEFKGNFLFLAPLRNHNFNFKSDKKFCVSNFLKDHFCLFGNWNRALYLIVYPCLFLMLNFSSWHGYWKVSNYSITCFYYHLIDIYFYYNFQILDLKGVLSMSGGIL